MAAIQRKPLSAKPAAGVAESKSGRRSGQKHAAPAPVRTGGRIGQAVQFWLHEEDRRLIRELAAWLAGQGIRSTDSMIIRATLRAAKTGEGLLTAYRQAAELDGRLKQHRKAS